MRSLISAHLLASVVLMAQNAPDPANWKTWLNEGVKAYKNTKYPEALAAFQKAVNLKPDEVAPRLYLATAWMMQYIPGADSRASIEAGGNAEREFRRVLDLDPGNQVALASLGSLSLNQANGLRHTERDRKFEEAGAWYERLLTVDPWNKEAYYTLGFIAWTKCYPARMTARARLGMKPADPGPLPDVAAREDLRNRFGPALEKGISSLEKALEVDPAYDDAMAYMNLLYREIADLCDTQDDYVQVIAKADDWVRRALDTKRAKAAAGIAGTGPMFSTPPPPPPPPGGRDSDATANPPQRIHVGSILHAGLLIRKVEPVYPPLAREARIQGTVRMRVLIGKDGRVFNPQVLSGHPLLVPAAIEAVKQWIYKPILLNGEPVEVVSVVDLNFALDNRD